MPKGKAAAPVATDGKVGPSTLESKRGLLERLRMSERSLEVREVLRLEAGGTGCRGALQR